MRSIVSEYQERVLACADEQHREQIQDGVPIEGAERDRRGDPAHSSAVAMSALAG